MKSKQPKIYFQSQSSFSRNCGVHVLNNLLGSQTYTKANLNNFCFSLSSDFINPYKSVLGGDFDITVLIRALSEINLHVRWLKKNEKISNICNHENFIGFLLNNQLENAGVMTKVFTSGRHWTCVRKQKERFVHLDSLEKQPIFYEHQAEAEGMLDLFRTKGGTILIVSNDIKICQQ